MVAVGGSDRAPVVVARHRFELCGESLPGAVYHVARNLDLDRAEELVRTVEAGAQQAAEWQLQRVVAELEAGGQPPERALALHERGARLIEHCNRLLSEAELRMKQLVARSSGVEVVDVQDEAPG
jgi:exodeoxyribonuclease VII small subunit